MTRTAADAITAIAYQSKHGPQFDPGECKRRTRSAYLVPSDGSDDATEAWSRTKHRLSTTGQGAPRGALVWWTGGSEGHGHVGIADGSGNVWSVDVKRKGFWDRVPFAAIAAWAPQLRFAGVSADIDGVQVIETKVPTAKTRVMKVREQYRTSRVIDLNLLDAAVEAGRVGPVKIARDKIDAAMRELLGTVNR